MTPKERVIAAIKQQEVDGIPSGFSYHFPKGQEYGDAAIEAHLKYFRETQADICKIMNDNRGSGRKPFSRVACIYEMGRGRVNIHWFHWRRFNE